MNGQNLPASSHRPPCIVPLYDTTALTAALANPYAQHYMSSHYYQAYAQARPRTTPDGYTLSSTYRSDTINSRERPALALSRPPPHERPLMQGDPQPTVRPVANHLTFGSWYQPGPRRCARPACPFTGSAKSVEIHMMDRHFVFPPGRKEKKGDDWDADPSLRGKPIAIQGTSIMLNTPEAVDAWIAERRRRFPTDANVEDKKRKREEATARGQLTLEDIGTGPRKKARQHSTFPEGGARSFRGRGQQRGRGHRRQSIQRHEAFRTISTGHSTNQPTDAKTKCSPGSGSSTDDDEPPDLLSSKVPTVPERPTKVDEEAQTSCVSARERPKKIAQPKKPPQNPFASRSTLLRSLLLPEIRTTASNLSQAIHFLVENDFLRDVELRPGDAEEQIIQVLDSNDTSCRVHNSETLEPRVAYGRNEDVQSM